MEDFNSKYTGEQVEEFLDQIANGEIGGGITVETDPVFSASPAASITEEKIAEWDAKSEQGEKGDKGDKGDTGVGVQSVAQTTTSNADGGSNVVTVTLTDGTKSTFTVKNGTKGSQGIQGIQGEQGPKGDTGANGTNGKDGTNGEDGATFTPSVDSAGNLSWSNDKGLANPPTVNIKGPKGDKGDAGEGGGGSSGGSKEIVEIAVMNGSISFAGIEGRPAFEPGKIYYATTPVLEIVSIYSVIPPTENIGEYSLHFSYGDTDFAEFEAPSDWLWANGIPTIEAGVSYELSVVATKSGNDFIYKAVLTKFKPVE